MSQDGRAHMARACQPAVVYKCWPQVAAEGVLELLLGRDGSEHDKLLEGGRRTFRRVRNVILLCSASKDRSIACGVVEHMVVADGRAYGGSMRPSSRALRAVGRSRRHKLLCEVYSDKEIASASDNIIKGWCRRG